MIVLGIQQRVMAVSIGIKIMRAENIANTFWLFLKTPLKGTRTCIYKQFLLFLLYQVRRQSEQKKAEDEEEEIRQFAQAKKVLKP